MKTIVLNSIKKNTLTILLVASFCSFINLSAQNVAITVDAGNSGGQLVPLWGDHYDLSITHVDYFDDPAFLPTVQALKPRYWRCSIGRWEMVFPNPLGGTSADTSVLKTINREYYRGGNNLTDADDAANYNFGYLDSQLTAIQLTGAEPYLCFDYMPFTLSSEKNPGNPYDFSSDPIFTFSNGIRTAPPADSQVYAHVVRNAIRHVRGQFAGTTDFNIHYIEIGNEPEFLFFYTGTQQQYANTYKAIATEVSNDAQISNLVKLGGGSFASLDTTFLKSFLVDVSQSGARLDFLSYHSYFDTVEQHFFKMAKIKQFMNQYAPAAELVNAEWGRTLDGPEPMQGKVEYGLFRTKVMMLMQLFGIKIATEAILILPGTDQFGLLNYLPVHSKPASDVYLALNEMNDCLNALSVTAPNDEYAMAGKKSDNTKVCIVYVGDSLAPSVTKTVQLQVNNLPWGNATYHAYRYEISDSTWSADLGVYQASAQNGLSGTYTTNVSYGPGPGKSRLMVWVLTTNPITALEQYTNSVGGVKAYPNPFTHSVVISTEQKLTNAHLVIYDNMGRVIRELKNVSGQRIELDREGIAEGCYFYKIAQNNKFIAAGKFMVQ